MKTPHPAIRASRPTVLILALAAFAACVAALPRAAIAAPSPTERATSALADLTAARALAPTDPEEAAQRAARAAAALQALADDQSAPSAPLCRSLGNARLLSGDLGNAVLWYRRAVAADPADRAALDSLDYARSLLPASWTGQAQPSPSSLLSRLPLPGVPATLWTLAVAWAAVWLGVLARPRTLRLAIVGTAACLALLSATVAAALAARSPARHAADQVVLVAPAQAHSGPDAAVYPEVFTAPIPAGVEARVVDRRDGWVLLATAAADTAWIPADAVRAVHATDQH
jgi:hypothetical protein